jgi:ribokinase
MKTQVVVVGSFVQDLTWRCAEFPKAGETVIGTFVAGPGGKGSNQAVAAGRAGAATLFIGAVGRDVFAQSAKAFYRAEGIGARFIEKPKHASGTAGILVNASGQNEIIVALGANAHLQPRDVDPALIRGAKIVICQHETNLAVNAHVFRLARKAGVTTVLNPAPMRPDFDPAILALVDVLIPNETEFVTLMNQSREGAPGVAAVYDRRNDSAAASDPGGHRPPLHPEPLTEKTLATLSPDELHALCRTLGVPTVILTLGARGCLVSTAEGPTFIPAHSGIRVVDTTGAGDAFVGGFAAGFVQTGGDLAAAAHYGNTVAALSVTKFGTAPSMPVKNQITRFLRRSRRGEAG